jgi:VWFA-related protein
VDVVLIDVSVLDRARVPIRGLRSGDFTILEDGVPCPLVSFDEVDVPEPDGSAAGWMREVAPDVRVNGADDRRIVLIVLDDVTISYLWTPQVRAIGRAIVDRLGPTDLAAVVYTGSQQASQEFTTDHRMLAAAVNRYVDLSIPPQLRMIYSVGTVRRAIEYLRDIPHRRKALFFVSSVGIDVAAGAAPRETTKAGDDSGGIISQAKDEMQRAVLEAQRANVSIYPINPAGLEVQSRPGPDLTVETLLTLANSTGGYAIVNTNTFDDQIRQVFRENGSYYLLGFQSAHADGKVHRIEVRTRVPGAMIRTRSSSIAPKPGTPEKAGGPVPGPLRKSIAGVLPDNETPMRVSVAPFAAGRNAALAIVLGVRQPAPAGTDRVRETVELISTATTPRIKSAASVRQTAQLVLRPVEGGGDAKFEVLSRLDVPPGRYYLRFGLQSLVQKSTGSVYHEVEVPDFAKEAVSLSGVIVSVSPSLPSGPADILRPLLSVVPTTQREFRPGVDAATTYLRIYQGGRKPLEPVALAARIVNERDQIVLDRTEPLRAEAFDKSRAAEYRLELPVARLSAGSYLLTFEASVDKKRARRDVRFVVR